MAKPNVVVILTDDLGYGDLGCFGNPLVRTPRVDAMAAEGVRLTQHYAGSPMCAPARAALLTGKYPHRVGAIDVVEGRGLDRIALREKTLADLLQAAGYATGCFGKWHNGAIDRRFHPLRRGFDEFTGFRGGICKYWDWVIERHGVYQRSDGQYLTDLLTDEAVDFIDRHHRHPFFLYVPYNAPHTPLECPDEDVKPFLATGKLTRAVATIYGMNARVDQGVGRILDRLRKHGLARDTLVLFTSDNGPMFRGRGQADTRRFNARLNGSKGSVLEGGIRVPAVARWPAGLEPGREVGEMVHFVDWLPTLLGAAGVALPKGLNLDGRDALGLLRGGEPAGMPRRFWQWNRYEPVARCNAAVRDGPWKLVYPPIPEALRKLRQDNVRSRQLWNRPEEVTETWGGEHVERTLSRPRPPRLYHLDRDPGERHDLADAHPDRVRRMQRRLDAWWEAVQADRAAIAD
ncbi:MAG: arylsulfatase [Planctomycetota bacterium]